MPNIKGLNCFMQIFATKTLIFYTILKFCVIDYDFAK